MAKIDNSISAFSLDAQSRARMPDSQAWLGRLLVGLRVVYAASFAFPLFNPAVNGVTLYFYLWLPILDFEFSLWMAQLRAPIARLRLICVSALVFLLTVHSTELALRFILIAVQVAYVFFLSRHRLGRYLLFTLALHIVVAGLQLWFFFSRGGEVPDGLTPSGISALLWGEQYAPASFGNFGYETFLPRVSGLHREAGFFSAYIVSIWLYFIASATEKRTLVLRLLIVAGLILSFSKITFVVPLILATVYFANTIDRIPLFVMAALILAVGAVAGERVYELNQYAELVEEGTATSLMHRFFSYYTLGHLDFAKFLFGLDAPSASLPPDVLNMAAHLYDAIDGLREYTLYSGFGGLMVKGGLVAMISFLVFMMSIGVRSSQLVVLVLATFSVGLDTLQNFVILIWYSVLLGVRRPRNETHVRPAATVH